MIQLTDDIKYAYAKQIKDIKESPAFQNNPDYELITRLERRYDRAAQAKAAAVCFPLTKKRRISGGFI